MIRPSWLSSSPSSSFLIIQRKLILKQENLCKNTFANTISPTCAVGCADRHHRRLHVSSPRTTTTTATRTFACTNNNNLLLFSNNKSITIIMTRDHHSTAVSATGQATGVAAATTTTAPGEILPPQQKEAKPSQDEQKSNSDTTRNDNDDVEKPEQPTAKRQKVENNSNNNKLNKTKSGKTKNGHRRPWQTGNNNSNNNNNTSTTNNSNISPHQLGTDKPGKDVHAGSYAHSAQRALFNIHLTEYDNDNDNDEKKTNPDKEPEQKEHRVKRKVAMLLGYVGTNYGGFQINEGQQTIQSILELSMYQNKFLTKSNFGYPYKYGWSTSGRTDKGVHACAQVISCKLEMTLEQEQDLNLIRITLNASLPNDIRVLDIIRVSRAFCAHTQRDKVRYQYMIPSFCLQNVKFVHEIFNSNLTNHLKPRPVSSSSSSSSSSLPDNDDADNDSPPQAQQEEDQPPDNDDDEQRQTSSGLPSRDYFNPLSSQEVIMLQDLLQVRSYRVTSDKLHRLKQALQMYQGTHSFHNLAKGVKANEARASRYIISFHVEDPIILQDGMEWIPTQVLGQSFLLHQIRKMVCLAIDVARHDEAIVPLQSTISRALSPQTIDMNMAVAPAQGLYLDMSFYNGYNQRKNQRQVRGEPPLPDLDWGGGGGGNSSDNDNNNNSKNDTNSTTAVSAAAVARWKEFRNGTVMKHVVSQELQEGNFIKHLYLQEFAFDAVKHYQLEQQEPKQEQQEKEQQALKKQE